MASGGLGSSPESKQQGWIWIQGYEINTHPAQYLKRVTSDIAGLAPLQEMVCARARALGTSQQSWFESCKSHLYHMSFQMHICTLSRFPIMPFNMFPSKSQKRVHAHVETSFRILQGIAESSYHTGRTGQTKRQQQTQKVLHTNH